MRKLNSEWRKVCKKPLVTSPKNDRIHYGTIGNVGMQMQCITMKKKQLNKQFYLQTKLLGMLLEMLSSFYTVSLTVDIF